MAAHELRGPVEPPIAPMLGKLVRELPRGDFVYEPKWDGFRCLVFRAAGNVELRSRNDRPLGRYFPELVEAIAAVSADCFVLDGEILVVVDGRYDFPALMARLHPAASRVDRLSAAAPATLVAFDLLALGDRDLRGEPLHRRRAALEALIASASERLRVTPATADPERASAWLEGEDGAGVDGVMAKPRDLPYRAGERAMLKVKLERTLDCVVAGLRLLADRPLPSSLLLGLYDETGILAHIGIAGSFSERLRRELLEVLGPLTVPLAGHPWERGFLLEGSPIGRLKGAAGRWAPGEMSLDWIPVAPSRVAEVSYDHIESRRLRHPARFKRWRDDRDPASCTFAQLSIGI
jgi:ATP-dependent DNA ligase